MRARIVVESGPDDPRQMTEEEQRNAACNITMLASTCMAAVISDPLGWRIWKKYVGELEKDEPASDHWLSTDVTRGNLAMVLESLERGHDAMPCRTEEEQEQAT
jgi:hypothetical protein